jgi:uncharacterized protein (DUF305 family)
MQGMDHGEMSGMEGMDQASMNSEEAARQMVAPNGEYSDAAFVDSMVPHHEGAVEMAQVALENAEHEEIRTLAQDIVSAQRAEIELFGEIREELGGEPAMEMSQEDMEGMMGNMDAGELANQRPFDRAFIDAMIPHHESAIAMANVALQESEDPEILRIAEDIVNAQELEISRCEPGAGSGTRRVKRERNPIEARLSFVPPGRAARRDVTAGQPITIKPQETNMDCDL